jgi:uncharacterized membrane protein YcaP (DUF421 family)
MESIFRGLATYLFVWLVFRLAGKRSLAQITTFDAVLLLIISETTQAALIDNDNSMTNCLLLILTMIGTDIIFSQIKRWPAVEHVIDGQPLLIVNRGQMSEGAMSMERVDRQDILNAARHLRGLSSFHEIDYAVLEPSGDITIIPKRGKDQPGN